MESDPTPIFIIDKLSDLRYQPEHIYRSLRIKCQYHYGPHEICLKLCQNIGETLDQIASVTDRFYNYFVFYPRELVINPPKILTA